MTKVLDRKLVKFEGRQLYYQENLLDTKKFRIGDKKTTYCKKLEQNLILNKWINHNYYNLHKYKINFLKILHLVFIIFSNG